MNSDAQNLHFRLQKLLWGPDIHGMSWFKRGVFRVLRILYTLATELLNGQLNLRAMSLVYTTLLSLVPLLAVSFALLKAFGVHNKLEPELLSFLADPLGEKGFELTTHIVEFVDNVQVGAFGSIGLALLVYTIISTVHKIEAAFNYTWRISRSRTFAERFSHYLSVILVGPLLVFSAITLTGVVMGTPLVQYLAASEPFGELVKLGSRLVPYLLVIAAFTFIYIFVPNTKVRLGAAFAGALLAAILWQSAGWMFALGVVKSTQYEAIYSSFAILVLFMIWIYVSWLILLVGASVAFYVQHPEFHGIVIGTLRMSNRVKERLALQATYLVARNYYEDEAPFTADALARRLNVPTPSLATLLNVLEARGMLVQTRDDPPLYLPSRNLESLLVKEVLDAVRASDEAHQVSLERLPAEPAVDELLGTIDNAMEKAFGKLSFKTMVVDAREASARPSLVSVPDDSGANAAS